MKKAGGCLDNLKSFFFLFCFTRLEDCFIIQTMAKKLFYIIFLYKIIFNICNIIDRLNNRKNNRKNTNFTRTLIFFFHTNTLTI